MFDVCEKEELEKDVLAFTLVIVVVVVVVMMFLLFHGGSCLFLYLFPCLFDLKNANLAIASPLFI